MDAKEESDSDGDEGNDGGGEESDNNGGRKTTEVRIRILWKGEK